MLLFVLRGINIMYSYHILDSVGSVTRVILKAKFFFIMLC
jgi:hypothetical protein